jgi:hypothetical protein
MHRPIFAANSAEVTKIYRITSKAILKITDSNSTTDFYNYDLIFKRYRAFTLQPGSVT